MEKVRAANLRLLRHGVFNTDQTTFSKTVNITQSKYSLLERGEDTLDDELARRIERGYKLPDGWMDRDNSDLFLSAEEFEFIKSIRDLSVDKQSAVIGNLRATVKLINPKG